jgi:parallel beta-helix repeat protein
VEVRVYHFWTNERMPIERVDDAAGLVRSTRRSIFGLGEGFTGRWAEYFVENVFEALSQPGEWFLDRPAGKLYYMPMPGETPASAEVVAAGTYQFLRLMGIPEEGKLVTGVTFRGLTFRYSDWIQAEQDGRYFDPYVPEEQRRRQDSTFRFGRGKFAGTPQVAIHAPGVISLVGVHNSAIIGCRIEHVDFWGINLADGCQGNTIEGNTIFDMGGGGIKVDGAEYPSNPALFSGYNRITDNVAKSGGRVFQSSAGIVVTHGFSNRIVHNEISDLFQTGISVGWEWNRSPTVSRDNLIEKNHTFYLGQKLSSDIGGIYLLGVQPGTVVRNNLIHDIRHAQYGGWGIYPDAATAQRGGGKQRSV